jgi:hypothetical protein
VRVADEAFDSLVATPTDHSTNVDQLSPRWKIEEFFW